MQEEKQLLLDLEKNANDKGKEKENEVKDQRLGEIYEQLQLINASSKESKARKILFGLGFNAEMQIRPTKYFSGNLIFSFLIIWLRTVLYCTVLYYTVLNCTTLNCTILYHTVLYVSAVLSGL